MNTSSIREMRVRLRGMVVAAVLASLNLPLSAADDELLLAFPRAEAFGADAKGAPGGRVAGQSSVRQRLHFAEW